MHGSYQRVGDDLRVVARLVDLERDAIEAQETLTNRIANVFALEDDLASRPMKVVEKVVTDPSRDALLTEFGKTTLNDRYLLQGESYQDMFARVATAFTSG